MPLLFAYDIRHIFSWPGSCILLDKSARKNRKLISDLFANFMLSSFVSLTLDDFH